MLLSLIRRMNKMLCYHSTWENGLVDGRVCVVSHIVLWPKQVQRLTSRRSNRGYDYHPVKNQTEPTVKMNRSLNFKATRKFFCTTYRTVLIKNKEKPPESPPPVHSLPVERMVATSLLGLEFPDTSTLTTRTSCARVLEKVIPFHAVLWSRSR